MSVYECSMFLNENDLLEVKINEHWDFVDKFIIVEAGETHTGLKKPFNFDHERFKPYAEKIIYVTFDSFDEEMSKYKQYDCPVGRALHSQSFKNQMDWARDHFQINYTVKVLEELGAQPHDLILATSVDEIVKPDAFYRSLKLFENKEETFYGYSLWDNRSKPHYKDMRPYVYFNMYFYAYKINLVRFGKGTDYVAGSITEFINYKTILPGTLRSFALLTHDHIKDGGWHFSSLDDGTDKLHEKMRSWAHSRDDYSGQRRFDLKNNDESLEFLLKEYNMEIPRDIVPIEKGSHPDYMVDNLDKFEKYILNV